MRTVLPNTDFTNRFVLFASYVRSSASAKLFTSLSKYKDKIQLSSDSTLRYEFKTEDSDVLHIAKHGREVKVAGKKYINTFKRQPKGEWNQQGKKYTDGKSTPTSCRSAEHPDTERCLLCRLLE